MTSTTQSERRQLGAAGPSVFPVALGCMGMSGMYGSADDRESVATIQAALDAGVTLLDTGDYRPPPLAAAVAFCAGACLRSGSHSFRVYRAAVSGVPV